jgi:hypothetical protein
MKKPEKIKVFERDLSDVIINGCEVWGYHQDMGPLTEIHLDITLKNRQHLIILIHELLHEAFPKLKEGRVKKISTIMGDILWRKGYRRRTA